MVSALIVVWIFVAITMKKPLHLKSLVVELAPSDAIAADDYIDFVPGVCDVVIIPEQKLAYFKIDIDRFCPESMERVLGRKVDF